MLLGTYKHSIDDKGRISVPAKFRSDLGERFVISNGLDGCIFLFPKHEWERLDASIRTLSFKESRQLTRYFYANAAEVEIDAQGRICIPPVLRDLAGLILFYCLFAVKRKSHSSCNYPGFQRLSLNSQTQRYSHPLSFHNFCKACSFFILIRHNTIFGVGKALV